MDSHQILTGSTSEFPRLRNEPPPPHSLPGPAESGDSELAACHRVLVCSTQPGSRQLICDDVRKRGLAVSATDVPVSAAAMVRSEVYAACVIDDAETIDGVALIASQIQSNRLPTQLLCLVARGSQWGRDILPAYPCTIIEKPYTPAQIGSVLLSAVERARLIHENQSLRHQLVNRNLQDLVGQSPAIRALRETIRLSADDDGTVLIRGERGTGTNLVAQGLHRCSHRALRPFVRIDCRLHSAESLETMLSGNGRPAVAAEQPTAYFELAAGGTIFLDNIECVALPLQKMLARIFESRQFVSTGSGQAQPLEARIVAATHEDLGQFAQDGRFREDLLHCLNSVTIQTPPLRVRKSDIILLAEYCLNLLSVREGRPVPTLTSDALELLNHYDWPSNVRELENVLERACSINVCEPLTAELLRPWLNRTGSDEAPAVHGMTLREMERKLIEATFDRYGGNRERTAQSLQIGLRTLSGKLREYGYPPRGGPGSNHLAANRRAA